MYPSPYSLAFCDVVFFAINFQLFLCFIVKAYAKSFCFWVINFRSTRWTNLYHLLNLHHTFIIFISHLNVNPYFHFLYFLLLPLSVPLLFLRTFVLFCPYPQFYLSYLLLIKIFRFHVKNCSKNLTA